MPPSFLPRLRELELSEYLVFRWRHHGEHPAPHEYEQAFWASTLCSFLVMSKDRPVGVVTAYDVDFANQHCKVGAARFAPDQGGLATITGTFILLDYLFQGWPFRKIYFESLSFNAKNFLRACGDVLEEEGHLREHVFLDGTFVDLFLYATYRTPWLQYSDRWLSNRRRE